MAAFDVGRVSERGGIDNANPVAPPREPRIEAGFERQLVTARAGTMSRAAPSNAGKTRTIAAAKTHISGGEAAVSLAAAYESVFHETPSPATLRVLVAQWSHETGGGRAMMNYNFGGIKGASPSGLSAAYGTTEGHGVSAVKMTDRFRAYGSALEGATDYVKFLSTRFSGAMAEARQGHAERFVRALKEGGYFTGSEEDYVRSVTRLTDQARLSGFDAIGHPGETANAVGRLAVHSEGARPAAPGVIPTSSNPAAQMQAYYVADALAMSDELCRAAMRIAATDDEQKPG